MIILKIITLFSPLRIFLPISVASFAARRRLRDVDDRARSARHELVGAADHARRDRLPRRPRVRTDLGAALRGPPVTARMPIDPRARQRLIVGAAMVGLAAAPCIRVSGYWVDRPLTHDEREYLALAASIAPARDSPTSGRLTTPTRRDLAGHPSIRSFSPPSAPVPATSRRLRCR